MVAKLIGEEKQSDAAEWVWDGAKWLWDHLENGGFTFDGPF